MTIYRIGRAEGNNVILGDKSVSRHHAELEELGAGRFRLKDLGSSSGTQMLSGTDWVDVQETEIRHDTRIRLGEYETTPADLLRDQDKTVVQARPAAAAEAPAAAPPVPPAPPRPAPPKPAAPVAAPKPAAPKPAAPKPAAPRPTPAGPRPAGGGIDKKTMWIMIAGGGGLLLLAVIAIVVVLVTGDSGPTTEARTPPAQPAQPPAQPAKPPAQPAQPPAQPAQPPAQPARPPATGAGLQKFTQVCRGTWGISEAKCACFAKTIQPILEEGDYDAALEVWTLAAQRKQQEAQQKLRQLVQEKGQAMVQRFLKADQAIGQSCNTVQ